MPLQGTFNANNIPPQQGFGGHPPGMFNFVISNTQIVENKEKTGGMFRVTFKSDAGEIFNNYNLWNQTPSAVEIANKELSALCHATGIFQLDFSNDGMALRGGRGRMEIGPQKNNAEYMEIKRVFDVNGNEPGKPGMAQSATAPQQAPQQAPQGQQQPLQQQPGGGWGNQQPQQQPNSGWGAPPPPPQQQTAPAPTQQPGGWQQPAPQGQAPTPPNQPPWAK